ncbi:MAG: LysM peptidoglycan-binding domain-containing protein [Bacteroidetes bacterium]|nr:MAG: LysM peptidoglycan-binding domain-containing protein [Bacteroidota bacterium]
MRLNVFFPAWLLLLLVIPVSGTWAQQFDLVFVTEADSGAYVQAHKVKSGETLYGIARQYELTVDELKALNGLKNNVIYPGQRLVVGAPEPAAVAERRAEPAPTMRAEVEEELPLITSLVPPQEEEAYPETDTPSYQQRRMLSEDGLRMMPQVQNETYVERRRYYEVKPGEDIYTISERFGVLVEELREWNALVDVEPGATIVVGKSYTLAQPPVPAPAERPPVTIPERVAPAPVNARMAAPQTTDVPESQTYRSEAAPAELAVARPVTGLQAHAAAYLSQPTEEARQYLLGATQESGRYARVEYPNAGDRRFYAVHKTLAPGTRVRMPIPNNAGFLELEVVARLAASSEVMVGLSPACVQVLESAGAGQEVTLFYN